MLAYVQFHCGVVKRDFVKTQREKKLSTMEKIDSAKLCKFFKKKFYSGRRSESLSNKWDRNI